MIPPGGIRPRCERSKGMARLLRIRAQALLFPALLLLLAFASEARPEEFAIRVLHVNDFHGFAEPHQPPGSKAMVGGAAHLAAAVNRLRQEKPSLLLSAGDMIQGSPWANFSKGASVIALMNALRFDAMAIGNHEFDFGQDILKKRIAEAGFPFLAANVLGLAPVQPYVVKQVGGVKVGILGVVAEDTAVLTNPRHVEGLTFLPVQDAVGMHLADLRRVSDVVIVVSHIGHAADRLLAERVEGIDFIIGGHSHTKVTDPPVIGKTMVLQAWEHGKALGVLDIRFADGRIKSATGYLQEITAEGAADREIETLVLTHAAVVDAALNRRIGETDTDLDGEHVRNRETNLGNLIADVVREITGADGALINGGAIRRGIGKGAIRARDVYSAVPFDNYPVAVKVRGSHILEALEHGFARAPGASGAFPQVSGIALRYDLARPAGSRISDVHIKGEPLVLDKDYTLATLDFISSGGDGYKAFGDALASSRDDSVIGGAIRGGKLAYSDPGRWLRDLVIDYIQSRDRINRHTEGRMVEVKSR